MSSLTFKANEEKRIVSVFEDDRKIYTLKCINQLHFYTVCYVAGKYINGEVVDMSFFKDLKKDK